MGRLLYHFAGKQDIVRSLVADRSDEAAELLARVKTKEPGQELIEQAVMRWIDSVSTEKLLGIRFMNANPLILRTLADTGGEDIGSALDEIARRAAGDRTSPERLLLVRMALLSINHAAGAAAGTSVLDESVIVAARAAATAIREALRTTGAPEE